MSSSRRQFLATAAAAGLAARSSAGNPLGKPIGLQLYMVDAELGKDFEGTLGQVARIGVKEVEIAATYGKTPGQWKAALQRYGLNCRSVHVYDPSQAPEEIMRFAAELKAQYVITSLNAPPKNLAGVPGGKPDWPQLVKAVEGMTLEDWKESAVITNQLGTQAARYGLKYAYHNHNLEFKKFGERTAYEMLMSGTDPALVKFELDCGWASAAGYDPAKLVTAHAERIRLLHIKAFQPGPPNLNLVGVNEPKPADIGKGMPDYKKIFAAAAQAQIEQYYMEQEPPFPGGSALVSVRAGYGYLRGLS